MLINWYIRNGLYRHAYDECTRLHSKRGADSHVLFWKAISAGLRGSFSEAIRDLHDLRPKREVEMPALVALIHFHERQQEVDGDEVEALRSSMMHLEDVANDNSAILAATFCCHVREFDQARRFVGRVLPQPGMGMTPVQISASTLAGWIEISAASPQQAKSQDHIGVRPSVKDLGKGGDRWMVV